jgi:hypothetical protein
MERLCGRPYLCREEFAMAQCRRLKPIKISVRRRRSACGRIGINVREILIAYIKCGAQRIAGTIIRSRADIDDLLRHGIASLNDFSRTGPPA